MKDAAGLVLRQEPITEPIRGAVSLISNASEANTVGKTIASEAIPYELDLQFHSPSEQLFGIRLYSDADHWTGVGFDRQQRKFYIDRTESGAAAGSDS